MQNLFRLSLPLNRTLVNCPIDKAIPDLDPRDPVQDKYRQKKTFVGEAFLELVAQLFEMPLLAYTTRNNGDFFQDVHPVEAYYATQTQKTDGELYYHNDRTAHPVRPDYLALLGMRSCPDNLIYTGYIDGGEINSRLTRDQIKILRMPLFLTPFDQYSRDSNADQVASEPHAILEDECGIRYYDTRTTPVDHASAETLKAFIAFKDTLLTSQRKRHRINTGDLLILPNRRGLHCREVTEIARPDQARKRWLLKTYNFASIDAMRRHRQFYDGAEGLVVDYKKNRLPQSLPVGERYTL